MAKYKIEGLEKKNNDWLSLLLESGEEVSVSRVSKKGEIFPNFDNLVPGGEVEGELWQSQAGNWYLFPPKVNPMGTKPAWAKKESTITKAMETKAQNIQTAQENRELGVKIASTMNKAIEIALAENGQSPIVAGDFQERVKYWRKWIYENWDKTDADYAPFPS